MIFSLDRESDRLTAIIQHDNRVEKYECIISACPSPVCTCGSVYLELIPQQTEDDDQRPLCPRKITIDLVENELGYTEKDKVSKADLDFANLFLSKLDEDDFILLNKRHFSFKNIISEEADPASIDAHFDYDEIEKSGLMAVYNDILPYGDQMLVTLEGGKYMICDQYCLLPKCSCTDTILSVLSMDSVGRTEDELFSVSLNYRKKRWKQSEPPSFPLSVEELKSAIERQIPDIYEMLPARHSKLKAIYANCKKKHFAVAQPLQVSKVGRNEPCPCGSGRKYKKCCLGKTY